MGRLQELGAVASHSLQDLPQDLPFALVAVRALGPEIPASDAYGSCQLLRPQCPHPGNVIVQQSAARNIFFPGFSIEEADDWKGVSTKRRRGVQQLQRAEAVKGGRCPQKD